MNFISNSKFLITKNLRLSLANKFLHYIKIFTIKKLITNLNIFLNVFTCLSKIIFRNKDVLLSYN